MFTSGMAVVCLQMLLASRGLALDPAKELTQYNCQTWSRQNGLMVNGVNAIAQTEDGYLWLGTSSGLVRYDGMGFTTLHLPQSGNAIVTSLASTRNGGLWVGLENSTFSFYDGVGWQTRTNIPRDTVTGNNHSLLADNDGTLWIMDEKRLGRLTPAGVFQTVVAHSFEQGTNILCGLHGSQDRFWYGTSANGVGYWQAGTIHPLAAPELAGLIIFSLAEDREENLWVGTSGGLFCYDANLNRKSIPPFNSNVNVLLVDRQGVLWIGSDSRGLARYANQQYDFLGKSDGLASDTVKSLAEDHEGSLWIGTRNGISQLTDVKFPTCAASEFPGVVDALSVCAARQGGIWIANTYGVTYRDGDGRAKNFGAEAGLTNILVKRVFEARNGDLYLVCGDKQLTVLSQGKITARYSATNMIVGLAEDDKGVIVSIGGFLFRAGTNDFTLYAFTNDLTPPLYWTLNLAPGRDGVIWAASANGITRIKDGTFQQWTKAEGLSDYRVGWVCEDSDGIVWASMKTGIARLKNNQIRCISEDNGLFDNNVFAIVPDDFGNLWVDSGRGIYRVSRQSMNDFADGRTQRVECTAYDGLESVKPSDKSYQEMVGCKSSDGRIWFPSANGVLMINPRRVPVNTVIPPVHIQAIRANGREHPRSRTVVVPPGIGDLEFNFAALSFIAPQKVRCRYELEGYDKGWVDAESRRLAYYANLKPGQYTFHVIAANADGVWNEQGDSVVIDLRPHFYQTGWFYSACGGLMLAALVGSYRGHVRRVELKEQKLKESRDMLEREVNHRTAELAYERNLLRALLDISPDKIYFKDAQSRFLMTSQSLAKDFGIQDAAALVGKTDFEFFAEEHAGPASADERQIIRTGEPITGKVEKEVWKDGRVTWVLTNKMPLRNPAGEIIGTLGTSKDITALKLAETELAYERDLLQVFLDTSPDAIFFKDLQSRFVKLSRSVVEFMRKVSLRQYRATHPGEGTEHLPAHLASHEQFHKYIIGKTDANIYLPEFAEAFQRDELEIIRTGRSRIGQIEPTVEEDGSKVWHMTTKVPWRNKDGQIIGTFGISKDITAIKEAEAKLKEVHQQLLETSRLAGMAEVATNVLHNVGNVLNSVNVSASLVLDKAKESKVPYLAKVVALLNEHAADLGAFITTDAKGRQLPGYLGQLAEQLGREREQAVAELELLRQNVEHIKDIVAMQQNYAKISGVTEIVNVADLVEDALGMNAGALARHGVKLVRDYSAVPQVTVEKHKVLQILINLIRNAKYACDDSGRPDKQLRLQIARTDSAVRIAVIDNGVGIPPENLARIFSHGFTTRKGGHGFGLHSGALAAKELGGSLTVHSAGPGQGATFTLELPIQPAANA